jgi:channel protein (hemolysin III family)
MSPPLIGWIAGAGITYSIGALIECFQWPNPKSLGYHCIWHFCVWGGATCHYIFVLRLMDAAPMPF